jgi:hypothetical protein
MSRKCFAAAAQMLCALVSGLQAGCTHTQPASMETETDNRERERYEVEKAKYEPLVGKTLWVTANGRFNLCPEPTGLTQGCTEIAARHRFTIDRVVLGTKEVVYSPHVDSEPYCHVTTGDGVTGYAHCWELEGPSTDVDQNVAESDCARHGGSPRVGFSTKLVVACWGKPATIKRRETAKGISEKYVWGSARSVLFHDGVAVTIHTER